MEIKLTVMKKRLVVLKIKLDEEEARQTLSLVNYLACGWLPLLTPNT